MIAFETLPRRSEATEPYPRVPTATSRASISRGVGADLLGRIARREARPDRDACRLGPRRRLGERRLGVLALGVEQVVEHRGRGVGEPEVALQRAPHGDHRDLVPDLGGEGDRLVESGAGCHRAVGGDEECAHASDPAGRAQRAASVPPPEPLRNSRNGIVDNTPFALSGRFA